MSERQRIPLPSVIAALKAAGFTAGKVVTYQQVYFACLNGTIPAAQLAANRWSVDQRDLPAVAAVLGLELAVDEQPGRERRAGSAVELAVV